MKRSLLLVCLAGISASSRSGLSQSIEYFSAPESGACGDTILVEPGAEVAIPMNLFITSDSEIAGFTISWRIKTDLEVLEVGYQDPSLVTEEYYSELHFTRDGVDISPVPQKDGQEVERVYSFPVNTDQHSPEVCGIAHCFTPASTGPGYTLAVVYFIGSIPDVGNVFITLPPGAEILVENNLLVRLRAPESVNQMEKVEFVFEDGVFTGEFVFGNIATIDQASVPPLKPSCTLTISTAPSRGVIPGDTDGSGDLTALDAIDLLDHIFRGAVALPCGDGTVFHPANRSLLDGNGDGEIDLADAIWTLRNIFLGSVPHGLGTDCTTIVDCPDTCDL